MVWFKKRLLPDDYSALRPVEKTVKGNDWKQRPKNQKVDKVVHCRGKTADGKKDLRTHEDNIYHSFEIGRVWTEMVQQGPVIRSSRADRIAIASSLQ